MPVFCPWPRIHTLLRRNCFGGKKGFDASALEIIASSTVLRRIVLWSSWCVWVIAGRFTDGFPEGHE